jgi:hypothetical protein
VRRYVSQHQALQLGNSGAPLSARTRPARTSRKAIGSEDSTPKAQVGQVQRQASDGRHARLPSSPRRQHRRATRRWSSHCKHFCWPIQCDEIRRPRRRLGSARWEGSRSSGDAARISSISCCNLWVCCSSLWIVWTRAATSLSKCSL